MKRAFLLLPLLAASISAGVSAPARAANPPVFIVSDKIASDRADELVKRALALGLKDRYAEAEPLLREAWSLKRSYDIAANLGIVVAALGKWRDAAEHLTYALKTFPANGKPEHRKLLELTLAKALPQVATLTVHVSAAKAEVLVDGKSVGLSPLPDVVFLEAGTHVIEARLAGHDAASRVFDAQQGGAGELTLVLRAAAPLAPTATGSVPPPPPPGGPKAGILVAGGVITGAAIVAGTVFAVVSNGKAGDAATKREELVKQGGASACTQEGAAGCQDLHDLLGSKSTFGSLAAWSFIGGGAVGVATVVYAIAAPRAAKAPVQVTPIVTGQQGGVVLRGVW